MGFRSARIPLRPLLGGAALWTGIAVALWFLAHWILMSDRGLDLGDEALYLLEASAPQPDAAYMFPAGWHTSFLFDLVGGDVPAFRTAGAVLLGLAGMWVGLGAAHLIAVGQGRSDLLVQILAAITGVSASWLYYFTLLRAPGYNWVNLMGMSIVAGAALRQWARSIGPPTDESRWRDVGLIPIIGFGTVFSLAGKPTTPLFIAVAYTAAAIAIVGLKRGLRALASIIAASLLWIPVLIILGWWDLNFFQVFWDAAQRPSMTPDQTPVQGLMNLLSTPVLAYQDFRGVSIVPVAVVSIALIALASNAVKLWRNPSFLIVPFTVVLLVTPFFGASPFLVWQQGWERGNLTVALLLVVVAALLLGLGRWVTPQRLTRLQLSIAVGGLILLSTAFGFGSSNTPYPMMKFAAVLLAAAALIALARVPSLPLRRSVVVLLAISMTATTAHLLVRSQDSPYGSVSLQRHTQPVTVGIRESTVFVDPDTARTIDHVRQLIQNNGGPAIRLIPIGPRTLGLAFGSGATIPKSIVLGWYGQPGAVDLARANLPRVSAPEWCDAWLLMNPEAPETVQIASVFADFTNREWPGDYQLRSRIDAFEVWAPTNPCG